MAPGHYGADVEQLRSLSKSMGWPGTAARGGNTLAAVAGAYVLLVAFLAACCILVPAAVLGPGRESFCRRLGTDPQSRAEVETGLAAWHDPRGSAGFGPL